MACGAEAVIVEFLFPMEWRTWIIEEGIKQIWNCSFDIFVNFDVVLRVFTFCYMVLRFLQTSPFASLDSVNNIFFKCCRIIKYSKKIIFFNEPSSAVERYGKFFPFYDITELKKNEKKNFRIQRLILRSCQDVSAMLEAVLYIFQTRGYVDV